MSEQDRFDWNEDVDSESEGDVQEQYDDFEDPLDGFADYDDMSGFDDEPFTDDASAGDIDRIRDGSESSADHLEDAEQADENAAAPGDKRRRRGISAVGLGFLFTVSILVAGVGIGGAILLAEGVHPASLWHPGNLLQFDQLLNFADHPLNILYMVTMGIVFLALLGSFKMSKAAAEANARTKDAEDMLDRLTALSLDRQEEWQSQEFKEFPPAEAFVIRALGAWRLQQARQKRLMGVEGELHRLEKALNTNSRADLTGRFDHPSVGRLADEMIRYFDARDDAASKLGEYEKKDRKKSAEILDLLQGSRQWNVSTLDQVSVNSAALDELAGQMKNLAGYLEKAMAEAGSTEGMTDIIEGIRRELAERSFGNRDSGQTVTELNDLVDRGSKLAFKIAMEVARLGPRGERLLPMSQALEDLTTGFRQLADRVNDRDQGQGQADALKSVHKKLETLAALITRDDQAPWRDMAEEVQDFGPAAARVAGNFTRMIDGFNGQEDRLVRLGTTFADMTGTEFDASAIARAESAPTLDFTSPRPLGGTGKSVDDEVSAPGPAPAEVNPFVTADSSFLTSHADSPLPHLEFEGSGKFSLDVESGTDMPLPEDEEKVYDLEDLGAVPAADPEAEDPAGSAATEEVFDLASFGAVPMTGENGREQDDTDEEVFDLSDFGASPVDSGTSGPAEEVYDLAEFGALALDQDPGSHEDDEAAPDEVFDLADFGAKPIK